MASFEDYIFETFASEIASWRGKWVQDIYALGLLIHFEEQDLRYGTVGLVYNTHYNYLSALNSVLEPYPNITGIVNRTGAANMEMKWHFDFWEQHDLWVRDDLALVAKGNDPHADPEGVALRWAWLDEQHLWYTDEEEKEDLDKTLMISGRIEELFYAVCVGVAHRLHTEGVIEGKFGHSIPIVFHNYWYDAQAAERTREANPPGIAEEFERYVLIVRHL